MMAMMFGYGEFPKPETLKPNPKRIEFRVQGTGFEAGHGDKILEFTAPGFYGFVAPTGSEGAALGCSTGHVTNLNNRIDTGK